MKKAERRERLYEYTNNCLLEYSRYRKQAVKGWQDNDYKEYIRKQGIADRYMDKMLMAIGMFIYDGDAMSAEGYVFEKTFGINGIYMGRDMATML